MLSFLFSKVFRGFLAEFLNIGWYSLNRSQNEHVHRVWLSVQVPNFGKFKCWKNQFSISVYRWNISFEFCVNGWSWFSREANGKALYSVYNSIWILFTPILWTIKPQNVIGEPIYLVCAHHGTSDCGSLSTEVNISSFNFICLV